MMKSMKVLHGCVWALLVWTPLRPQGLPLDCRDEQSSFMRCTSISQDKLLERLIQHAEVIYRVSEESCATFEEIYMPITVRSQRNRGGSMCLTKSFPIPNSKNELQQVSDRWLLHSVLMLVQSWMEPLVYVQASLERHEDIPETLLNKTKWMSEKLLSLEQGVAVLIRKILDEGVLVSPDYKPGPVSYETEPGLLRDYTLLTCFKKDVHKMETFLKLLKCRQTEKFGCFLI